MAKYQPGWKLLGQTVKRRRDRLGITQEQVAEAGGPSVATLRLIENAQASDPRSKTLFALDQALGWDRGSAIGLVEGQIPPGNWSFEFDEFVDDLIDYVSDTTRENFDVPVSPRHRRFDTGVDLSGDASTEPSEHLEERPVRRGLAALLPTRALTLENQHWGGPEKDTSVVTDEITDHLELLSLEQLDHIAVALNATRRAKRAELGRVIGLPDPFSIRHLDMHENELPDSIKTRLRMLKREYERAYNEALRALTRKLDAEKERLSLGVDEGDPQMKEVSETYQKTVNFAAGVAAALAETIVSAKGEDPFPFVEGRHGEH